MESQIYHEFDFKTDSFGEMIGAIEKYNTLREESLYDKILVLQRIINHVEFSLCGNPFVSMSKDKNLKLLEDSNVVLARYNYDYYALLIHLLTEREVEEQLEIRKRTYLANKYHTIFLASQLLERKFLFQNMLEEPIIHGRESLILFGHNPDFIRNLYIERAESILKNSIASLKALVSLPIQQDSLGKIELMNIESALSLLESKEIGQISLEFCREGVLDKESINSNHYLGEVIDIIRKKMGLSKKRIKN